MAKFCCVLSLALALASALANTPGMLVLGLAVLPLAAVCVAVCGDEWGDGR